MSVMNQIMGSGKTEPTNAELAEISKLAEQQRYWEGRVKQLDSDLENAKESLRQIQEHLLPEAMGAIGMSEFKLTDGYKITIKDDIYSSIRKENITGAIKWLDDNGLGGIIKSQVEVSFGRGEYERAHQLVEFCNKSGMDATEKESVHPMTLKATVKEQMAKGVVFPEEFFSVHPVRKSIIK